MYQVYERTFLSDLPRALNHSVDYLFRLGAMKLHQAAFLPPSSFQPRGAVWAPHRAVPDKQTNKHDTVINNHKWQLLKKCQWRQSSFVSSFLRAFSSPRSAENDRSQGHPRGKLHNLRTPWLVIWCWAGAYIVLCVRCQRYCRCTWSNMCQVRSFCSVSLLLSKDRFVFSDSVFSGTIAIGPWMGFTISKICSW